jgi:hypothetical protein
MFWGKFTKILDGFLISGRRRMGSLATRGYHLLYNYLGSVQFAPNSKPSDERA